MTFNLVKSVKNTNTGTGSTIKICGGAHLDKVLKNDVRGSLAADASRALNGRAHDVCDSSLEALCRQRCELLSVLLQLSGDLHNRMQA